MPSKYKRKTKLVSAPFNLKRVTEVLQKNAEEIRVPAVKRFSDDLFDRLCAHCGKRYGFHFGDDCYASGAGRGFLWAKDKKLAPAKPALSNDDWTEIYYALLFRLNILGGSDSESVRWRAHLKRIITTIGPDGKHMYKGAK